MREQGITVAFYNPTKRNKRMQVYQEYINHIFAKKNSNAPADMPVTCTKEEM